MTATVTSAAPAEAPPSTTARSPTAAPPERAPVLTTVPRPLDGEAVAGLGGAVAGGLEAVQAEWGLDGGEVVLTGRRPFLDVTGRAAFRADGTLSGDVRMRANLQILGLPLGVAEWTVVGWSPAMTLATPAVQLRGTDLRLDLASMPPEAVFTPAAAVGSTRDEAAITVPLPGDALPAGEPLSPRYAELFRGLLRVDVSGLSVHPDAPVDGAPAFVANPDLFFAAGMYGIDSPDALGVLDAAVRAALAGLVGPVGGPEAAPPIPADPLHPAPAPPSSEIVSANVPGDTAVPDGATDGVIDAPGAAVGAGDVASGGAVPLAELGGDGSGGAGGGGAGGIADVGCSCRRLLPRRRRQLRRAAVQWPAEREVRPAPRRPCRRPTLRRARRAARWRNRPLRLWRERKKRWPRSWGNARRQAPKSSLWRADPRRDPRENDQKDEDDFCDPTPPGGERGGSHDHGVSGDQSAEVAGAYDAMASPPAGSPALTPTPVVTPEPASPGMGVDAASAAPDPSPPKRQRSMPTSPRRTHASADSGMETRVTAEIPDGPFADARAARGELANLRSARRRRSAQRNKRRSIPRKWTWRNLQMQAVAAMRSSREPHRQRGGRRASRDDRRRGSDSRQRVATRAIPLRRVRNTTSQHC